MSLKDLRSNILRLTDSYNSSHQRLKINTDWEVSHMYNRKEGMILYGFQEIVTNLLETKIERWMVDEVIEESKQQGLVFPAELFYRVVEELDGCLPLKVECLPEGTWCPAGTPFAQISNTVEGFGEIVTWWEGVLMMAYFPSACATQAFHMRNYLLQKKEQFSLDDSFMWKFHSFGFRGHKSLEDAYFAGTAWALFLNGTDDFHIKHHVPTAQLGSISALAHKVTQQYDNEFECFRHAIDSTAKVGEKIVALVIDTYDADRVIREYLLPLAQYAERKGIHIVMRPDSGDVIQQALDIWEIANRNKLKNVSVIIGEGMSFEISKKYDQLLESNGVPINFVFYGIGAGFYKDIDRDTLGWAMKTAYSNGKPRMKFSMVPLKRSIPGRVVIDRDKGNLIVRPAGSELVSENQYITIYEYDGGDIMLVNAPDWEETRQRALVQSDRQEVIYLDSEIQDMIKQFQKVYL